MKYSSIAFATLLIASNAHAQTAAERITSRADRTLLAQLIRAQDTRARADSDVAVLKSATQTTNTELRLFAVRALGRLERSELIPDIAPALDDSSADVRLAAVQAIGQAAYRNGAEARKILVARLQSERSGDMRAKIAETLGRLAPANAEEAGNTARLLARLTFAANDSTRDAPATMLAGVARGFFFLSRRPVARGRFGAGVPERLRRLIAYERQPGRAEVGPALRREISSLAAAALIASGSARPADVEDILNDPDPSVREKGTAGLANLTDTALVRRLMARAFADTAPIVRYRAVGVYSRLLRQSEGCAPLVKAARDEDTHVALAAIDELDPCASDAAAVTLLDSLASAEVSGDAWHRPAHAVVSLAMAVKTAGARERLRPFLTSKNPFVRTYAARGARALSDTVALRRLARDRDANTKAEAIEGLAAIAGHSEDSLYVAALGSNDSQVLMAASKAVAGNRRPTVIAALSRALDRVSALRRETSRDARLALLDAIRRNTDSLSTGRVARYLRDFDPVVATRAAEVLQGWVGNRPRTIPVAPPAVRRMSVDSLLTLADKQVTIEMQDGGRIVVGLFPLQAPTNVARFVRLAQRGYFDGLTFHRVAPYFVVQGGSPRANEYVGDGPFTRDEIGVENRRGTLGLSTRGRDTGDGQIYFNLIDNVQLDPDYTVFAYVVNGMELVDRMQEGAPIKRIRVNR